jgi:hypothetical protein
VFVPGKSFQPSLMFAGKAVSLPERRTLQVLNSRVGPRPHPQTLDKDWKGLPGTNTLAYFENS